MRERWGDESQLRYQRADGSGEDGVDDTRRRRHFGPTRRAVKLFRSKFAADQVYTEITVVGRRL